MVCRSLLRPEPMRPATPRTSPSLTLRLTGPRPSAVSSSAVNTGAGRAMPLWSAVTVARCSRPTISLISRSSVASATAMSATSAPLRSTTTRSAASLTSSRRCPTKITAPPLAACSRASLITSPASTGPSADVGSSRISSRGLRPSALATSSSCLAGIDSVDTGARGSTSSPTRSSMPRAAAATDFRS